MLKSDSAILEKSKNLLNDLEIKRASFAESLNIADLSFVKELFIYP